MLKIKREESVDFRRIKRNKMAKQQTESKEITEIRTALGTEKIILGTERVVKELKKGTLAKIFVSSNCPENIRDDLSHYASFVETETIELDVHNEDLGVVCKKPFSVSVLGLKK